MDNIRAQTTSKNGEISCSVEETNRIRAALGLKPLRVTKPPAPSKREEPEQPSSSQLRATLQASRLARRRRGAAIAPRSIAEQALYDDDDDDDDPAAWVERSRVRNVPRTPLVEEQKPAAGGGAQGDVKTADVAEGVEVSGSEKKVLTLRDADVIDAGDDVLQDDIAAAAALRRKRDEEINGLVYDGTDNKQFENVAEKSGVESVAEVSKKVDQDYESDAVFRKVKKRAKKRRRRDPGSVVQGSAEALRKAADAAMVEESDDDEHYELLRKATAKAAERNVDGTVNRILKAVQKAEKGGDEEMEDGARLVGEEMAQFLGVRDMYESETDEEDRTTPGKAEDKEISDDADREEKPNVDVKMEDETPDSPRATKENPVDVAKSPTETIPEAGVETNGMTGIAATLARLRTKGELKDKARQKGRAKDKRFNLDSGSTGKKEIKLSYLDEFGNQLTAKEAFRVLCHSFHGRGPGQNKREKRLRKMLEAAKKRSMQGDDTPLASAAALKAETQRLGSAHVVLSGSQALQIPRTETGKASE